MFKNIKKLNNTVKRAFDTSVKDDWIRWCEQLIYLGLVASEAFYQGILHANKCIAEKSANSACTISACTMSRWNAYARGIGAVVFLAFLVIGGSTLAESGNRLMRAASERKMRRWENDVNTRC